MDYTGVNHMALSLQSIPSHARTLSGSKVQPDHSNFRNSTPDTAVEKSSTCMYMSAYPPNFKHMYGHMHACTCSNGRTRHSLEELLENSKQRKEQRMKLGIHQVFNYQ